MQSKSGTAIGNAFRIIECTREILKSGLPDRCPQCEIHSCRQVLSRYVAPIPGESGRKG